MSNIKKLVGDWVESTDQTSGKKYYANTVTKVTSWTMPPEVVAALAEKEKSAGATTTAPELPEGWVEKLDPNSGKMYYYNKGTRETTWVRPAATPPSVSSVLASVSSSIPELPKAKPEWNAKLDKASGKMYYYNSITKETTWTKPEGFDDGASSTTTSAPVTTSSTTKSSGGEPVSAEKEKGASSKRLEGIAKLKKAGAAVIAEGKDKKDVKEERFAKLRDFALTTKDEGPKKEESDEEEETIATTNVSKNDRTADLLKIILNPIIDPVREARMEMWAEDKYNLDRKGLLGKKTNVEKLISWKPKMIKKPLLKSLPTQLLDQAIQANRNIVGFMDDRETGKVPRLHALKLIKSCLHAPEDLRDEIYCQSIKQTTKNTNAKSLNLGWLMIAIFTGVFPPSREFEPYLMYHCFENSSNDAIGKIAKHCLVRVKKVLELGPRNEVPTEFEIESVMELRPVIVKVYLLDGTFINLPVESWTTASDFNKFVAAKLGIEDNSARAFATFEIASEDDQETLLDPHDRILDLIAYWQRVYSEEKVKAHSPVTYHFVYKVHMFFQVDMSNPQVSRLMFLQAVHDVRVARYPCTEQDCLTLAALVLQNKHGDYNGSSSCVTGQLDLYMPSKYIGKGRDTEIESKIIALYAKLHGYSKDETRRTYLEFVKSWPWYGSSFFFVEPIQRRELPPKVFLAINPEGILIGDRESKEILKKLRYGDVPTWGHSISTFVIHVGNLIRQDKIQFHTDQGKEMNQLVGAYVKHLIEKNNESAGMT